MFEGKEPAKSSKPSKVAKPPATAAKPVKAPRKPTLGDKLEAEVGKSVQDVRSILGKRWARRPEFGTRLHAALKARLQAMKLPRGWHSQADQPLRNFPGADQRVMRLTVRQWLAENPHLQGLRDSLPSKVLEQTVGDMKADLLLRGPQGQMTVWDLTSVSQQEHLAKTMLYGHLMTAEGSMIRFAEMYWAAP